jgi:hypothetical protein
VNGLIVLEYLNCEKFLLQWKILSYSIVELLTLNDTVWIAPDNWIVQDIIPGQYVDNLTILGVTPFSIPGLDTKLTNEIVTVENEATIPDYFLLEQNYPNPFNPSTTLSFVIGQPSFVSLKIFDVLGNKIVTLVNEEKPSGSYEVEFNGYSGNGINLTSGVYFHKLQAGNFVETKKMILLR